MHHCVINNSSPSPTAMKDWRVAAAGRGGPASASASSTNDTILEDLWMDAGAIWPAVLN
jgi:hypothetical protein